MKKIIIVISLILILQNSIANDGDYSVSKIPAKLLENANAVLRLEDLRFEIISTKETNFKNHYVITILNEKGDYWAELNEYYDKYREINSIEGILYDANGKEIKKVKKKDIEDISGVDGGTLMDDSRFKRYSFYYKVYPYTIEYTIETTSKSTFSFPSWTPQEASMLSVEQSSMSVVFPADYHLKYKAFNFANNPKESIEKNKKTLTWSIQNLQAFLKEPYAPIYKEITPNVIFAPTEFQMDEYKGNMNSWEEFGKFIYALKQGKDQLPENIKKIIHQISDNISDPKEKIAKLYEYMQDNTRYISIQLGIGGLKPFTANDVATKRYGDCKALSNYMYSVLKEAGLDSYYTLVKSGDDNQYFNSDFPSNQFNHVILCVPVQKDTMWLECTSQTMQAGYLGEFTSDRPVLLIDETGGKLVRTPTYKIKDNLQVRKVSAVLDEKGNLSLNSNSRYSGLQQDSYHDLMHAVAKDKIKEILNEELNFSMYEINAFDYKDLKTAMPSISESLNISVNNYATVTGKRIFISPNILTKTSRKLSVDSTRKFDIQFKMEYKDVDSVEIKIPDGYVVENLPAKVSINNNFGSFDCSTKLVNDKIVYYRTFEQKSGRFKAEKYQDLVDFFQSVYKADRTKVVLLKQ